MTNHVHLLATPQRQQSMSKVLQSVGRRYVQYFNSSYQRTGTLWEGRYRATIVDGEQYLLTCMRYIELNPVRAGMFGYPGAYRWSSYQANVEGVENALVRPHELYDRLGPSAPERQLAYGSFFIWRFRNRTSERSVMRRTETGHWGMIVSDNELKSSRGAAQPPNDGAGRPRPINREIESDQPGPNYNFVVVLSTSKCLSFSGVVPNTMIVRPA